MAGIYIHIPFCKQACHYCDFHFSTQLSFKEKLIGAIIEEIRLQEKYLLGDKIKTIYFGGGTPSILSSIEIKAILDSVQRNFEVTSDAEITLEANPDDLSLENLMTLKALGINRLSIGIQSFNDTVLSFLNRAHNQKNAIESVENARKVGFENISIDLIYSIPHQSISEWKKNISTALSILPEHISAYSLTIEDRTAFGNWQKKGKLIAMDDDSSAQQFEVLMDILEANGYHQYEISNFCRPGYFSRHNSSYWSHERYLGIGPSAHSYNGESRQFNVRNNSHYIKSIENGLVPYEQETLSRENRINEYILTSIRTSQGLDLDYLKNKFGFELIYKEEHKVELLKRCGKIEISNNRIFLTKQGKLVADKIASDFFVDT